MSTKKEQAALVAFFNSFGLSKRITTFDNLNDGQALLEVMSKVDASHFKSTPARRSSSGENWVLKMNTLKRLYRLLLSFPLPPPNPASLSLSSLPTPPFQAIAQSYTSPESTKGLLQICRMCLSVAVWAPGNEKAIAKIQSLGEAHMTELMKGIEGVMATLPSRETGPVVASLSDKQSRDSASPPPTGLRAERDKLLNENDELRQRCESLISQITQLSSSLEEATAERDEAVARSQNEVPVNARNSQTAATENEALRADLATAEDNIAKTESALEKQLANVRELTKQVEDFKRKAEQASKLKDQLDEYRQAAEKLQKTENVIGKYKKKLEDSAGLRRELRVLEADKAALTETNARLETELRKAGSSKALIEQCRLEIETLKAREKEHDHQIGDLNIQLENAFAEIEERERALQEKQAVEVGSHERLSHSTSEDDLGHPGNTSLGDELANSAALEDQETRAVLRARIQALQEELAETRSNGAVSRGSDPQSLLAQANAARNRYQSDYHEAYRKNMRLQASLNALQSANGNETEKAAHLEQRIEELDEERKGLLNAQHMGAEALSRMQSELDSAHLELSLVDKDDRDRATSLRKSLSSEAEGLKGHVNRLQGEIPALKEKDRLHLQEIEGLLMDKMGLQSDGLSQRELALEREKKFSNIRAEISDGHLEPEIQARVLQLESINAGLETEVQSLSDKLEKAKDFIRNQDALFRAEYGSRSKGDFDDVQKSYEAQIISLKADLLKARQASAAADQRYKLEQQLMLSAWHELGSRTVRDHLNTAAQRRSAQRPVPISWLGRQRRQQEEATFSR